MQEHKNNKEKVIRMPIMEIFGPTIQGEGIMSGTVTHFLRTGGCGLRCSWCDSMHAVDPAQIKKNRMMLTGEEIMTKVKSLGGAPYITFTGGDPCLQKHLGDLIDPLHQEGIRIAVETQGQLFPEWLARCDVVTFSPKGPSSGNIVDTGDMRLWLVRQSEMPRICIKVVVFDQGDFDYAMNLYRAMSPRDYDAFYFTAGTPLFAQDIDALRDIITPESHAELSAMRSREVLSNQSQLADAILEASKLTQFNDKVHVGCQQHVLLWPTKDKGV